jgi:hypothetical protein
MDKILLYIYSSLTFLVILFPIATWWLSHRIFKTVRAKSHSHMTTLLLILGCSLITVAFVAFGLWLGNSITSPIVRSLGATSCGTTNCSSRIFTHQVNVNLMWLPFLFLASGIWAGFMSGYLKFRIGD